MKEFLLGAFLLFGCGVSAIQADVSFESPLAQANNIFGCDLYAQYLSGEKNILFSPYSLSSALSMTYEGARGDSARKMRNALHFSTDDTTRQQELKMLMARFNALDKPYALSVANALWAQQGYAFLPEYFDLADRVYMGKVRNLDFKSDTENARITINAWVEERTNSKIKDLISAGALSSSTRLVLTNAVYFKAEWTQKFEERNTSAQDFWVNPTQSVKADLMFQESFFGYAEDDKLQAISLPYKGGDLSMIIFLPKDKDLSSFEKTLSAEAFSQWKARLLAVERVEVVLPKFKFEASYQMKDALIRLGMGDIFVYGAADFSGMNGNHELYVGDVLHKAFIEVNEDGTEAAAATAVMMAAGSAAPQEDPKVFRADHPFFFVIQDNMTGLVLFMGRVMDPTK
ncbi:MAG: serpin family protein [Candidatus Omnitrophica bacterium]|nr:serpin family protein [Candidatus Omnitrophota bacterium]